jgi:hypothetical protein
VRRAVERGSTVCQSRPQRRRASRHGRHAVSGAAAVEPEAAEVVARPFVAARAVTLTAG